MKKTDLTKRTRTPHLRLDRETLKKLADVQLVDVVGGLTYRCAGGDGLSERTC